MSKELHGEYVKAIVGRVFAVSPIDWLRIVAAALLNASEVYDADRPRDLTPNHTRFEQSGLRASCDQASTAPG
jgi:hypothetical protein